VAVVGSGIAGLGAARALAPHARVTLFEAGRHFGGHANTVDLTLEGITHGVDTGFLVFNDRTYPNLIRLFGELGVATPPSDMSFSVQVPQPGRAPLEWSGSSLDTVFAQRANLARPGFWRMLADLLRFNRLATRLAQQGQEAQLQQPVGEFLREHRFSEAFRDWYLLPMVACIWSCPTEQMLRFPIATLIRFCHNHGLLQISDRPQWRTVAGGSRQYVQRIVEGLSDKRLATPVQRVRRVPPAAGAGTGSAGVWIDTAQGSERFDEVVLACHSNQALALLHEPTAEERDVLGAIRYHRNRAVLHTDAALLPRQPKAWAAWNYERAATSSAEQSHVCLHYLINRLQPLPWQQPVIVSLNPVREPHAPLVQAEIDYDHPVFDLAAIGAQQRLPQLQGQGHVWFCGAWTRYGFHEDGLASGLGVARGLLQRWQIDALQHDSAGVAA
jgi:predicted NAD/FAD-binding protein